MEPLLPKSTTSCSPLCGQMGAHFMRDLRDSRNDACISRVRNNGLFYSSLYAAKLREGDAEHRLAAANILNAHLLMVEIMMSNLMQKYVYDVYSELQQRGLMRHLVKKHAKSLYSLSFDLQSRCNKHDVEQVRVFCRSIYPSLVDRYIEDGGTLTTKMQWLFQNKYENQLSKIYISTKNVLDKIRVPESELCTKIEMVLMLAFTGIEFYNEMCRKVDSLLDGFGRVNRVKSFHNEKFLCAAKELLRIIGGGKDKSGLPEKESSAARTFVAQFQSGLVSEGLLAIVESGISALRADYIEYLIATLRIKLHRHELSITDIRTLVARVGSVKNVRKLLAEIADTIPYGETDATAAEHPDAIDLASMLPDSVPDSALFTFRRLCLEDHVLLPEKEDEHKVRCRELRQEARSNGGALPLGTLKALYAELKTKKAVSELLRAAGEELGETLKMFDKIKVKELKA